MQIAVAAFVSALPRDVEVILAGGTQMLAVAALIKDMGNDRDLLVATTKYVKNDKSGCFVEFAEQVNKSKLYKISTLQFPCIPG